MSTNDVPGAKASNKDELAMGCWAEHEDGSLIFVEGTEGATIVYCIFDVSKEPVVQYRDAMPEASFKSTFSWGPKAAAGVKWTWHDKTPFDWKRVMSRFPDGQGHASADGTMSAAERVAESLRLRGQAYAGDKEGRGEATVPRAAADLLTRIGDAIVRELRR